MKGLSRREFLKQSSAAGVGLAAWPMVKGGAQAPDQPLRPNILVFLTDDHGQWAQHAYGNSELITPNLDRLARQGTRMVNAFTPCPVCSPARASFLTGRMPSQHGIHDWLMEAEINEQKPDWVQPWLDGQTLISELLKAAGYHTGLVPRRQTFFPLYQLC
jgi:arylsulfatase A-like enzyme